MDWDIVSHFDLVLCGKEGYKYSKSFKKILGRHFQAQ